jgi:hypothetical protein
VWGAPRLCPAHYPAPAGSTAELVNFPATFQASLLGIKRQGARPIAPLNQVVLQARGARPPRLLNARPCMLQQPQHPLGGRRTLMHVRALRPHRTRQAGDVLMLEAGPTFLRAIAPENPCFSLIKEMEGTQPPRCALARRMRASLQRPRPPSRTRAEARTPPAFAHARG